MVAGNDRGILALATPGEAEGLVDAGLGPIVGVEANLSDGEGAVAVVPVNQELEVRDCGRGIAEVRSEALLAKHRPLVVSFRKEALTDLNEAIRSHKVRQGGVVIVAEGVRLGSKGLWAQRGSGTGSGCEEWYAATEQTNRHSPQRANSRLPA